MTVYKGNGGVTTVALGYTTTISSHRKVNNAEYSTHFGYFSTFATELPNTQVHIINAEQIQFKTTLDLVQRANICSYDNVIWVLDSFEQTSTNYVTSTWTFAPMMTYRKLLYDNTNRIKINGLATSTINMKCAFPFVNGSELPQPSDTKRASTRELYGTTLSSTNHYLIIRMSLPPKLRTGDINPFYDVGATSISYNSILATGDIYVLVNYEDDGGAGTWGGIALLLTELAKDKVYAGCVTDVYVSIEYTSCWKKTKKTITLDNGTTLSIYIPAPIVISEIKLNSLFDKTKMFELYTREITIACGDQTITKSLYDLFNLYPSTISDSNDERRLFAYVYPTLSSEGGKYIVTYGSYDGIGGYTHIGRQQILAEFTRPCIGLQPIVDQATTWWQSNEKRFNAGLALHAAEAIFSVLTSLLGGSRQLLEATSAGAFGLVSQVATKEMLMDDLSAISAGSSGAGSFLDVPLVITLVYFAENDYTRLIYLNPPRVFAQVTQEDYLKDTSPIFTSDSLGNDSWIQGHFAVESSYLTGHQRQKVAEMLQQGVSINYNVGIGYQGA